MTQNDTPRNSAKQPQNGTRLNREPGRRAPRPSLAERAQPEAIDPRVIKALSSFAARPPYSVRSPAVVFSHRTPSARLKYTSPWTR
eukprot:3174399-Prymnesium_polylepis.1